MKFSDPCAFTFTPWTTPLHQPTTQTHSLTARIRAWYPDDEFVRCSGSHLAVRAQVGLYSCPECGHDVKTIQVSHETCRRISEHDTEGRPA